MYKQLHLSVLMGLLMAASIHAEENFRQHDAHVHGSIEMNIAQDGQDLAIEVTAPGMDVVGFEHPPQTEQEHNKIAQMITLLQDANQLFTINSEAQCKLESAHAHKEVGEHEHHDELAGGNEHEHEHEHGNHSEFNIEYRYHCENSSALSSLKTAWFEHFPNTHAITANIFTDREQTSTKLDPEHSELKL